jgi:hypothetical protein
LAIERLGQYARDRSFANTAGACKQIGVVETLGGERVSKSLHHVFLPHHFGKGFGTVFAGQH